MNTKRRGAQPPSAASSKQNAGPCAIRRLKKAALRRPLLFAVSGEVEPLQASGPAPALLQGEDYEAKASSAIRFRITSVDPSSRINCFFFKSLNNRVTVSRDAPIICAISS